MPTIHGERAVLRFVGQDHQILELSQLNLPSRCLDFIETFLLQREGSLIVAGPTGAGKTSTLYAVLSALSEQNLNCVSIEDPVEVQLKDISQTSLPKNLSYAAALRALLRQDPDAILVGEIRDLESAQTAIQSALTGHLVLSSVHARSVLEIGLRFKHFEIDTYSLAQALSLLVCQRLLPRLCEACKVFDLISSNQEDAQIYRPHGCSHCDYSGYHGSVPICEALQIDSALAQVIRQGEFHKFQASLLETTYDARYLSLIESARCALRTGQIGLSQFRSLCEQTR